MALVGLAWFPWLGLALFGFALLGLSLLSLTWLCLALLGFGHALVLLCLFLRKVNSEEKISHDFDMIWSSLALALIMPWSCVDHALDFLCLVLLALLVSLSLQN